MATAYGKVRTRDEDGNLTVVAHGEEVDDNVLAEGDAETFESALKTLPDDMSPKAKKPAPAANAPTKKSAAAGESTKQE